MRYLRAATIVLLIGAASVQAQQLNLKSYGREQGLSNLVIQCMLQDRQGFLWVGTQAGLFRYDGARFQLYAGASGLPSGWISALHEDQSGTLWAGTRTGVARRVRDRFVALAGLGEYEVSGGGAMTSDASGAVYVATNRGLLVVRDQGRHAAFEEVAGWSGPVQAVHRDARGDLWLAGRNGLVRTGTRG